MKRLDAPEVAANSAEVMDVLWLVSEWTKAQCNCPALSDARYDGIRQRLSDISGALQSVQSDIAVQK